MRISVIGHHSRAPFDSPRSFLCLYCRYNVSNGGPAQEALTDAIFAKTKTISRIAMCSAFPDVDLGKVGRTVVKKGSGSASDAKYPVCDEVVVEVIDSVEDYGALLATVFDFPLLRSFVSRPDFSMVYDALAGVAGAYATRILGDVLGVPASSLHNCVPLPDFGGHHPDPNLTYAPDLVHALGLKSDGSIDESVPADTVPQFGAAQDGDADRNMILGKRFFVTPSDSVAVIAANAEAIPFFASKGGLKGVARSMPTSAALDRVAAKKGLQLFEVPTGWKFFGNLVSESIEQLTAGCCHLHLIQSPEAESPFLFIIRRYRLFAFFDPLLACRCVVLCRWTPARWARPTTTRSSAGRSPSARAPTTCARRTACGRCWPGCPSSRTATGTQPQARP